MCLIPTMVFAGILGGSAHCLFYKTKVASQNPDLNSTEFLSGEWWLQWCISVVMGIAAAFTVPVFLDATSSNLVANIIQSSRPVESQAENDQDKKVETSIPSPSASIPASDPSDWYVFFGFCVIAAFASQRFMPAMVDRMLRDMQAKVAEQGQQIERQDQKLEEQEQQLQDTAAETADIKDLTRSLVEPGIEPAADAQSRNIPTPAPVPFTALTADEQLVLRQLERGLREKLWLRRAPAGIAQDAGIPVDQVETALNSLAEKSLVVRHSGGGTKGYSITEAGRQLLPPPAPAT